MMINAGQTANFVVWYDDSLTNSNPPNTGPALAQAVLDYCEYDLARLSLLFGGILPSAASLPITVNLVPGTGGAWNNGVNAITCNISSGSSVQGINSLVVAEEAEILMNVQANGWSPGWSNGEALSRVSAQLLYPNRAWLFATGRWWLNSNLPPGPPPPRPDWVDQVEHTDQDDVSVGCGTLFLNYLAYQLNLRWPDIIAAGAPTTNTLAETATKLNVQNAYQSFYALLAANYPPSTTVPVSLPPQTTDVNQPPEPTDDLFPIGAIPSPSPVLYMRHNTADNGTSHAPPLSSSPDIILKNNPVATPQATFSTPASIRCPRRPDELCVFARLEPWRGCRQRFRDSLLVAARHAGHAKHVESYWRRVLPRRAPWECGGGVKSGNRLARRSNPRAWALLLRGYCGQRGRSRSRPHLVCKLE